MPRYVDGFVIPIKKKNLKEYKKMAQIGCKVWMEHGALDYYECVWDGVETPFGISFSKLSKLRSDETVIFAFIIYKSKAHAAQVNKKVHSDPRMKPENFTSMPFDMKRMSFGKFETLIRA